MDLDEARGVISTPTGLLRVDRVVGHQRVGRVDGHRFAGAAVGFEGHGAGDVLLVGDQERFEVVTQRFVEEPAKDEIGPLPCGVLFEGRLGFGQREFFKTAVRHQQGFDARALKDDASLQAHDGVAGVDAAAHAVGAEGLVELREHVGAGDGLAIQRHWDTALEFDGALGRGFGPLRPGLAHAVGVFARGTKLVNLGTGDGGAEQVFVDGVLLVMVGHVEAAGLEVVHLVGAEGFGFRLDVANRCEHGQVAHRTQGLVKAELVVAHGGAPVGDRGGAEALGDLHEFFHDDVAVGTQQGIPLLVLLAAHHKGLHEGIPQGGSRIGGDVFGSAELEGAVFDGFGFTRSEAAGVNVHGHHVVATLDEPRNAERSVKPARKSEHGGSSGHGNPLQMHRRGCEQTGHQGLLHVKPIFSFGNDE